METKEHKAIKVGRVRKESGLTELKAIKVGKEHKDFKVIKVGKVRWV